MSVNLTFPAHQDVFFRSYQIVHCPCNATQIFLKHKLHYVKMRDFHSNHQHDFR